MNMKADARDDFADTEFEVPTGEGAIEQLEALRKTGRSVPEDEIEYDVEEEAVDDNEVELEIIDDTPPEDRNRKPLPKEVVEELEHEEAEEYSAKVKQRIDQMKKAWHDERREKEAAMREMQAAADYARQIQSERDNLRRKLSEGETWALFEAKKRAELELAAARSKYKEAYEGGDPDEIADAQQMLSRATSHFDRTSTLTPRYALQQQQESYNQPQQFAPQPRPAPEPAPDYRAQEWGEKNKWFGTDQEMTSFALGVHQKLVSEEGINPQSEEYYERVDARMREVFPKAFGVTKKRRSSTVVAPAGRAPKGKKVVLTQSQVAIAKKLGVSPEAYARELMKQENR